LPPKKNVGKPMTRKKSSGKVQQLQRENESRGMTRREELQDTKKQGHRRRSGRSCPE
jgi:hypothetical protein